jgi:hypothetical protein
MHTLDSQMIIYDNNLIDIDDTTKNFNNVSPEFLPQRKRQHHNKYLIPCMTQEE